MKKEIYQGSAYSVDTDNGIVIVPLDIVGDIGLGEGDYLNDDDGARFEVASNLLLDFVEGEIQSIEKVSGWLGRLSMPGYLDATEWEIGESKQGVSDILNQLYGDDEAAG
jgi:hypothetical protein